MSRTPADYTINVVRGATWEDEFLYTEDDKVTPIDLTGYAARMQVRTEAGRYGTSASDTLVHELTTENERLVFDTAEQGRLRVEVAAIDTLLLNPENARRVKLYYDLELYRPEAGADPEYVIPLVRGAVAVQGETTR